MRIVSVDDFDQVVNDLVSEPVLFFDSETTGLRPHHGDRFFSLIIGSREETFYFNFKHYPEFQNLDYVLETYHLDVLRRALFERADLQRTWVIHNAKFDLGIMKASGCEILGDIHCTKAIARIINPELMDYDLDALAAPLGFPKDAKVKDYIKQHKLYTKVASEWTGETTTYLHFDKVPFDIISPYGCRDVDALRALYLDQIKRIDELDASGPSDLPGVRAVVENEKKLIRTVFEMEYEGVLIDKDFCVRALRAAERKSVEAMEKFKSLTGEDFKSSGKLYQRIFESEKDKWVYGKPSKITGKVNPSFAGDVIKTFTHPAARAIVEYNEAKSEVNYFAGFLDAADPRGVIHTNLNQDGTITGRFSSSNPNLQNMTKDEDEDLLKEFVVRRAIIPRPGKVFHMIDYKQMEYRLLLDYAGRFAVSEDGVKKLIAKVKAGHCVHKATAELSNTTRPEAKTTNFATIFGAGINLLASNLGKTVAEAEAIKEAIFKPSPEIPYLIHQIKNAVEKRGYLVNWFGRIAKISDPTKSYRGVNYLIQGGCADAVKLAMNRIRDFLLPFETKLILMIHDELVLEGPAHEAEVVIKGVKEIMESVYPAMFVPLEVDIEHSYKSLADKADGIAA